MSDLDRIDAQPGEWVRLGPHLARSNEPLMRPTAPEVWSHLVAFVRERLAERRATPDVLWAALERLAAAATDTYNPRAVAPGDSDIDAEETLWHVASIWRDHPTFRELLDREYDRRWWRPSPHRPDRETWIREWAP